MRLNNAEVLSNDFKRYFPQRANFRNPVYFTKAIGSKLIDVNGKEFIDFSSDSSIMGHNHLEVIKSIQNTMKNFMGMTLNHPIEISLAEAICRAYPNIEKMVFTPSHETTFSIAINLARAYTAKIGVIKFEGCFHSLIDSFSSQNTQDMMVLPFNDLAGFKGLLRNFNNKIAAVIMEIVPTHMGLIIPDREFLMKIREITEKNGIILIFDETTTGFRLTRGGASEYYQLSADLTCLGKNAGGGLPLGVVGGRSEIMKFISSRDPSFQEDFLKVPPPVIAAGIKTLEELRDNDYYRKLSERAEYFYSRLEFIIHRLSPPITLNYLESMFTVFFQPPPVSNYGEAVLSDYKRYEEFSDLMLKEGIVVASSQLGTNFLNISHRKKELDAFIHAFERSIEKLFGRKGSRN